jgi:hypothetical protein
LWRCSRHAFSTQYVAVSPPPHPISSGRKASARLRKNFFVCRLRPTSCR